MTKIFITFTGLAVVTIPVTAQAETSSATA
jgi:hypothetical protein